MISTSRMTTIGSCSVGNSCSVCYDLGDEDCNSKSKLEKTNGRRPPTTVNVPGLNTLAQVKAASDDNLVPFSEIYPKQVQQGNPIFHSINTNHAAWAPGFCQNISKYEGRFLPKLICSSKDEPKRTKFKKRRKLLAKRKRDAFKKRLDLVEKNKFRVGSETTKSASTQPLPDFPRKRYHTKKTKKPNQVPPVQGLRGGTSRRRKSLQKCDELQLSNRGTDCFVNSVVQLLRQSDYASFIQMNLPSLLINASKDDYKLCRSLAEILFEKPRGEILSAAKIRSLVSLNSKKSYFDNNTQQDAEEFLLELEAMLTEELITSEEFLNLRDHHWGQEKRSRKFINNSEYGECHTCGKVPASQETPFLILKLTDIPRTVASVSLVSILNNHFSESPRIVSMRCPNCCKSQEHEKNKVPCPQTGLCKARNTTEVSALIKTPKYLFIQLTRNVGDQPKLQTFVEFNDELILPSGDLYEPVATLDHIGNSPISGHYVTFLKLERTING